MSADARRKRLTLVAAILGSIVVFVDSTIINVALPRIRGDLGSGLSGQQWIVDAYLLTLSSFLLIGGSLADVLGRRLVFAVGVAGFGLTSLICAVAPTIDVLIIGRALQGLAGALLVPSTLGLIIANFDENDRGTAIGSWTAWTGIATVIGPLGGGAILEIASWRWVFAINLVPIAITLFIIARLSAEHDHPSHEPIDIIGAVLCAIGLGGPVFALIEQPNYGWGDPLIFVPLVGGTAAFVLFLVYERRSSHPMLSLDLFKSRNFAVGNAATLAIYASLGAAMFLLAVFLQQVAGYSPLEAGAATLPMTLLLFFLSKRFGRLSDRYGPRFFMSVGPLVAALGVALLMRLDRNGALSDLIPAVVVFGLGLALTVAPLTAAILGAVDERHAGIASGTNNAVARVASLLAIALVGAVIAANFGSQIDDSLASSDLGPRQRQALESAKSAPMQAQVPLDVPGRASVQAHIDSASVDAFHLAMGLMALLMAAGGLGCALGIENPRRPVQAEECPGGPLCGASPEAEEGFVAPEAATV